GDVDLHGWPVASQIGLSWYCHPVRPTRTVRRWTWIGRRPSWDREAGPQKQKAPRRAPLFRCGASFALQRIIHLELDRVRGHFETRDFGHLQLDIGVDEIVVEHAAVLEERAVLVEVLDRLAERVADGRDRLQLFLRQVIEVL